MVRLAGKVPRMEALSLHDRQSAQRWGQNFGKSVNRDYDSACILPPDDV